MDMTNMRGNSEGHGVRQHTVVHETAAPQPAAEPAPEPEKPKRKSKAKGFIGRWWKWALAIIVVIGVGFLIYGYISTKNELDKARNPTANGQSPTQQVVNQVGKLAQLPTGETPTLATVNDASKLKNQVFFTNAQNGDKVLIYSKAGVAVLYRPSTNRIIQFSLVNLNGNSSTSGQ